MYKKLLIVGAGGHGQCCREIALDMKMFSQIDFLDDKSNAKVNIIGKVSEMNRFYPEYENIFIAIGNNEMRCRLINQAKEIGYTLVSLISPYSYISPSSQISQGSVIFPHAVINTNTFIGTGCIISAGSVIDHDARVENYCHVNASAIVSSMAIVKAYTKVDYGQIYRNSDDSKKWMKEYEEQFGHEPSFF